MRARFITKLKLPGAILDAQSQPLPAVRCKRNVEPAVDWECDVYSYAALQCSVTLTPKERDYDFV